jgi:glycosyltransferase involved in cell wall biosynthesis
VSIQIFFYLLMERELERYAMKNEKHRNIRVFHILGYLASRYGGPPKVAIGLGRAMSAYGIDACWWATASSKEKNELAYLGGKAFLFPPEFPHSWYRSQSLARELKKRINEADILHLHQIWDYPIWTAAKLARQTGKPYIVTTHGIFSEGWRYGAMKKQIYMKLIAHAILKNASVIHAVNKSEITGFKKVEINAPYVVVPHGIEPDEFEKMPNPEQAEKLWPVLIGRDIVLYMGRLSPEKGLNILLASWSKIKVISNALLVIAGPDYKGFANNLRNMISQYGLNNRVLLTGMIMGDAKKAMLSRANMFVLPSYSEGLSTVVLEALAAEIPCIITNGCNFPEIQKVNAGYVVPAGDIEALTNAVLKMMAQPDLQRKEMGRNGRRLIMRKYTINIMAKKMLAVYRYMLEQSPVPCFDEENCMS